MTGRQSAPLIAHIVYRLDVGGLENGLVNLINHMPWESCRHMIFVLTEATGFCHRVQRGDVEIVALHKPPGHAVRLYPRLFGLLRQYRPAIVHTRNLAALEMAVPAWAAGVPVRIHGEHGRDTDDPQGTRRKYRLLRRLYSPFVTSYVALSRDLEDYLCRRVGIAPQRVTQIYNGVDTAVFRPAADRQPIPGSPFADPGCWLLGTVGRMAEIKDQTTLARAFVRCLELAPELRSRLRLVVVGEGPLRSQVETVLDEAGLSEFAWLPGERDDVPDILRGLDCFVLPSRAEGVSNAILEAMATGLPVIATSVGGNGELVRNGENGLLVPAGAVDAMAAAIIALARDPDQGRRLGQSGRRDTEEGFGIAAMVGAYRNLYERLLAGAGFGFPAGREASTPLSGGGTHVRHHGNL